MSHFRSPILVTLYKLQERSRPYMTIRVRIVSKFTPNATNTGRGSGHKRYWAVGVAGHATAIALLALLASSSTYVIRQAGPGQAV